MSMEDNPGIFIKSINAFYQFPRTSITKNHKLSNNNRIFFCFFFFFFWQGAGGGHSSRDSKPEIKVLAESGGRLWERAFLASLSLAPSSCWQSLLFLDFQMHHSPVSTSMLTQFLPYMSKITSHKDDSHWISLGLHFNLTSV